MWTQQAKADKGQGVETSQLFFDSESRQVQSDLDSETNAEQARALALQSQMVQVINRLQQRKDPDDKFDHVRNSFGGKGVAAGKHNHVRRTCSHRIHAQRARLTTTHFILRFPRKSRPQFSRCPRGRRLRRPRACFRQRGATWSS